MKVVHKMIYITGIALSGLLSACSNFEEINTNPDSITQSSVSMQCTNIILGNIKFNGRDAHAYLQPNAISKYLGFANQSQMSEQYNSFGKNSFDGMTMLPNIDQMLTYAAGTSMEESYKGVAKFSRAYLLYKLTMRMGDIPYSEANQALSNNNYRPKYDAQKDVLLGVLNELKEADGHFAKGVKFDGDPTPYEGNPEKWRQASNALALRILMSMSKKEGDASLRIKERFAEIANAGYLLQESTGFLGLKYTSINMHPMAGTNDIFTSRTVISSLLIDELKKVNDRRLFYFSDPSSKQIDNGKSESDMDAYVGADVSMDYATMTDNYLTGEYSLLNARYLKDASCEPRMMITYAEQQLILAEGRIRGWITNGTAESYYKEGVKSALKSQMDTKSSYAHGMEIDQDYIDTYFNGEAAFKASVTDQLKQIWLQRYILNFMQDPEESYFEYRRNNYPDFPINPSTNLNLEKPSAMPMRWLYPSSETNYNRENLEAALKSQYEGYDEVNKIMWILK